MKVCITGGSGYVGQALIPRLLAHSPENPFGREVVNLDMGWFGMPPEQEGLTNIQGDIRDLPTLASALAGCDAVLHLACISNDTSCGLDESLSTSINYDAFKPLVIAAKLMGIKRFVYCSSSSVYGVSDAPDITEEHPLVPLTLYNRYKGMCEPILMELANDAFTVVVIRPATVCGYSPRMRFDLTANILTAHAVKRGKMTVFGGEQRRPNLHISDMCRVYETMLTAPHEKIHKQIFNIGTQNMSLIEIAEMVRGVVKEKLGIDAPYERVSHTDNRSYHINSQKIKDVLGFVPEKTIADAVGEMCDHFAAGEWDDALTHPRYTNVVQLQRLGFENKSGPATKD